MGFVDGLAEPHDQPLLAKRSSHSSSSHQTPSIAPPQHARMRLYVITFKSCLHVRTFGTI
jgi:hypothetical protein